MGYQTPPSQKKVQAIASKSIINSRRRVKA